MAAALQPALAAPVMPGLSAELAAGMSAFLAKVEARFDDEVRSDLAPVATLVRHVARFRGKMLRPMLVALSAGAVGAPVTDDHVVIGTVVEMAHMATLVHDDVLDDAELRRRGATINHLKGNEAAVLLGDYLISHSYHLCSSLESQFAARAIAATTNRLCEGELLQLENRGNLDLTEAVYTEIVSRKTAALIATSSMLGAKLARATDEQVARLERFGHAIGIAFQIQDDVLDLVGDAREVGKSLGSDVSKAKLTLPLIHFLKTAPHEHRALLKSLLRSTDPDRPEKVRNLVAPSDAVAYAHAVAKRYVDEAIACLDGFAPSASAAALRDAARFVVARSV
jgi:octaprenyl-diphosphate synthase